VSRRGPAGASSAHKDGYSLLMLPPSGICRRAEPGSVQRACDHYQGAISAREPIIHLIRSTFRYASRRDWDALSKDLRPCPLPQTLPVAPRPYSRIKSGSPLPPSLNPQPRLLGAQCATVLRAGAIYAAPPRPACPAVLPSPDSYQERRLSAGFGQSRLAIPSPGPAS
jgi:hypothetical protein